MHRTKMLALAGLLILPAAVAVAQDAAVSQTVGHGQINWTAKTITATGSGAPNLKAANVAVARLGAERAAKMDALRNILEAVKGVRISGGQSAGAAMDTSPEVKSKVEGLVQNFKVLDTKYYSDGGVDVIVQVPLDGVLLETLVPQAGSKASVAAGADASGTTGIIINAKGLALTPALAPRILDDKGGELYGAAMVTKEALQHGIASYVKSIDQAMKDARVAGKPLVVKATKLAEQGGSDLVIGGDDAAKLGALKSVLSQGKVIIVTD